MSIDKIQTQIASLRARAGSTQTRARGDGVLDHHTLFSSLEEMSRIAETLSEANAQVERRLAVLYAVMRALSGSDGAADISRQVLQAICEVLGAEFGAVWIFDGNTGELSCETIWQSPERAASSLTKASKNLHQQPDAGLPGNVYVTKQPLWIPDLTQVEFSRKQAAIKSGFKNALLFPLCMEEQVMGAIECFSRAMDEPGPDMLELLDALGNQIGAFTVRKTAENLLAIRVQQQAVVAQLGQRALLGIELQDLFDEVAAQVAQTLSVDFTKLLELIPDEDRLLLRAGAGWKKGLVGHTYVDVGPRSQGGYSLSVSKPIAVTDLSQETRFKPSAILAENGVVSGLSVIIPGRTRPFGILGAHSTKRRLFSEDDIHFLQAVAHVLAAAIERHEIEEALRLSRHEISVILDGIADGITAQGPDGQIIYANDAAARLIGLETADQLLLTPVERVTPRFEMFDEDDKPLAPERLPGRQVLLGQPSAPITIRFKVRETGEERWSIVKAQPVLDEDGRVAMAVNIFQDVTELKRAELAQRLLADAGNILETSMDYETRLNNLARILVPRFADWCAIDLLDEKDVLQRVAVAHIDPDKVRWAHELSRRFPPNPDAPQSLYTVVRKNQPVLIPAVTAEMLAGVTDPEVRDVLDKLTVSSIIQVPLVARGHGLGTLSLTWAESGRHYNQADLSLARVLAERAALALDNARLYAEAQRTNTALEQRVQRRTAQLQKSNVRLKDEIKERLLAENQIRSFNAELEQRVNERTTQLEKTNRDLQHEIVEREQADRALQQSLLKTRELYEISQNIGLAREPNDVLSVLLSSSYLESAIRASVALFDGVWNENGGPPQRCTILAAWDRNPDPTLNIGEEVPFSDYGPLEPHPRNEPFIVFDVHSDPRVPDGRRKLLLEQKVVSSIIFPLNAAGKCYGLLSLHFGKLTMLSPEDIRHLRGLVDEAAMAIYNFRLLQTEAAARREAEEANNLKLKFLAMISHELRTPLTSIKGFATTLLAEDVEWQPEHQRDFIETIDVEADKLTDLIEQLLDLSRLEAGTMRIATHRATWDQVLMTAMAQLQTLTVNHRLVIEAGSALPALQVDVMRVAQVLANLVNNAVKYSQPDTTITLSVNRLSDQFVKVAVSDQGLGIPVESRKRVFEAFQQLEREKEGGVQGAGLGLAICRGLVEAHGGRIWVEDRAEPGTTIAFTLPISQPAVETRRTTVPHEKVSG